MSKTSLALSCEANNYKKTLDSSSGLSITESWPLLSLDGMKTTKVNKPLLSSSIVQGYIITEEHVFFCLRKLICKIPAAAKTNAKEQMGLLC